MENRSCQRRAKKHKILQHIECNKLTLLTYRIAKGHSCIIIVINNLMVHIGLSGLVVTHSAASARGSIPRSSEHV